MTNGTLEVYCLLQALPSQIADNWQAIKWAIQKAQPDFIADSPERMNAILEALLAGQMQCWVLSTTKEAAKPIGVAITTINDDKILLTRSLYIFSFYGMSKLDLQAYNTMYETLAKFGRANKCKQLTAATSSKAVLATANRLGAEIVSTFIAKEI